MLTKVLLTCREVARLSSREFDTRLPAGLKMRMKVHSALCKGCFRYRKQLRIIHELISSVIPGYDSDDSFIDREHLSDESRERIRSVVEQHE